MITLPTYTTIAAASPTFVDAGFTQRGISSLARVDRKGSRYKIACSCGPFAPDQARVIVSRLIAAKTQGMRIFLPILHSQGSPGSPKVDGAISASTVTLAIKDLTPGYSCGEGFWLNIVAGGRHYLHNIRIGAVADGSGNATVTLNEPTRALIGNNATIHLEAPSIEGLVEGDEWQWSYAVDRVVPINFTIEEAA